MSLDDLRLGVMKEWNDYDIEYTPSRADRVKGDGGF